MRDRLCDTYENDAIFDKFEVQFSGDSKSVMTGSYNNSFMIYPNIVNGGSEIKTKMNRRKEDVFDEDDDDEDNDVESPGLPTDAYPQSPSSQMGDEEQEEIILQADKSAFKSKKMGNSGTRRRLMSGVGSGGNDFDNIDFKKSILHLSWHPREDSVAIAATNNLYIFSTL